MGDKKTLAMARKELEEMYVGVADDSVNLSFQDLADVMHKKKLSPSSTMEAISESGQPENSPAALAKLPSLDFNRALQEASVNHRQVHHTTPDHHREGHLHHHHHHTTPDHHREGHLHHHHHQGGGGFRPAPDVIDQRSFMSDDMSHVSGMSYVSHGGGGGRRRRPGIPHSNVCTVCSTYIYIFRHRCLVCGRVYCRQCVAIGMGEMSEGRKCKDCLGRRFSQRYIKEAGKVGCCFGYPSTVKQQELKWAEKGPRIAGEAINGHRSMVAPRSPRPPLTPTAHHSNTPSFVASSPYSHNNNNQFLPL